MSIYAYIIELYGILMMFREPDSLPSCENTDFTPDSYPQNCFSFWSGWVKTTNKNALFKPGITLSSMCNNHLEKQSQWEM